MRILILSNYYPPFEIGGWEQLTADMAAMLARRGHSVQVLTSRHRAGEVSKAQPGIERVFHLESPDHLHYNPKFSLFSRRWEKENEQVLIQKVGDYKPDIIFITGMWNLPRSLARTAEQLLPYQVVYYMASPWPAEPDAHTLYWQLPVNRAWLQRPKQLIGKEFQRWLLPKGREPLAFRHVLCVSEYMRRFIAEEAGVDLENCSVVYNGIDPAAFSPKPPSTADGQKTTIRLLYAGQLRADKGVHTAVEAVGQALRDNPSLRLSFTIYGSGAPAYIDKLRERIQTLSLTDTITLSGQIPREQIPSAMAGHDVLLFPSVWPEPLARVVQEAMAVGLVVIGTTTGGTPELLQDGLTGLTFAAEDADGLARQIGRLARDPALFETLAQAARQTVESRFTQERMVDEIEAYFQKLGRNGDL